MPHVLNTHTHLHRELEAKNLLNYWFIVAIFLLFFGIVGTATVAMTKIMNDKNVEPLNNYQDYWKINTQTMPMTMTFNWIDNFVEIVLAKMETTVNSTGVMIKWKFAKMRFPFVCVMRIQYIFYMKKKRSSITNLQICICEFRH